MGACEDVCDQPKDLRLARRQCWARGVLPPPPLHRRRPHLPLPARSATARTASTPQHAPPPARSFELRKNVPCTLTLTNPTGERVAFKVKTTSPKKYCVRPSSGFVEPGGSKEVQVIMQAQREYPPSLAGAWQGTHTRGGRREGLRGAALRQLLRDGATVGRGVGSSSRPGCTRAAAMPQNSRERSSSMCWLGAF